MPTAIQSTPGALSDANGAIANALRWLNHPESVSHRTPEEQRQDIAAFLSTAQHKLGTVETERAELVDALAKVTDLLEGEDIAATPGGEDAICTARSVLFKHQA